MAGKKTEKKKEPVADRYGSMVYRRCGRSGLMLPAVCLGLWHYFGKDDDFDNARAMVHFAFDRGVTHFDIANAYGPPPGHAERWLKKIMKDMPRDELIVSTKAGFPVWPGPYGNWGSRKHLIASCDQSLKRSGLDYFDIFYHHRPDPETPVEETMAALEQLVRQGKVLYAGVSSYDAARTAAAARAISDMSSGAVPLTIHQPSYNMMNRWIEDELIDTCEQWGIGIIPFIPLNRGLLTDRYLHGIPEDSRAAKKRFVRRDEITEEYLEQIRGLAALAEERGQTIAQLAIAWILRDARVTAALIGASRPEQIEQNLGAVKNLEFTPEELARIDRILGFPKQAES